jgi:NitT/TauT family transport system ATP-binding protein
VRAELNSHQFTRDSSERNDFQQSVARIHRLLFEETETAQ